MHLRNQNVKRILVATAAVVGFASMAQAADMAGAGSTFVYPILSKWAADYDAQTGNRVNYQSIGSGGGIAQIKAGTLDFGASDQPLKSDELSKAGLGQFPLVIGGVVPVVNISGVKPGEMKFTGPLLADIYLGKNKKWNAPAIKAINPSLSLPDSDITVVHRSDGSGTTFNWANYLSKVSEEWKTSVGAGMAVDWPVGIGGKGNEGVAEYVNRVKNSIGYVEYAYVLQNKMTYGAVKNQAGQFVVPNSESFQAAVATADWKNAKDFYLVMTDAPGDKAYPVTATTFVIMYKQPKDEARSKTAFEFFKWAIEKGQKQADDLNYVPLPKPLVEQIEEYWKSEFKINFKG